MSSLERPYNGIDLEIAKDDRFRVEIDYERTDEVLGTLLDLYKNNKYPYNLESTRVPIIRITCLKPCRATV